MASGISSTSLGELLWYIFKYPFVQIKECVLSSCGIFDFYVNRTMKSDALKRAVDQILVERIQNPSQKERVISEIFDNCFPKNSWWVNAKRQAIEKLYNERAAAAPVPPPAQEASNEPIAVVADHLEEPKEEKEVVEALAAHITAPPPKATPSEWGKWATIQVTASARLVLLGVIRLAEKLNPWGSAPAQLEQPAPAAPAQPPPPADSPAPRNPLRNRFERIRSENQMMTCNSPDEASSILKTMLLNIFAVAGEIEIGQTVVQLLPPNVEQLVVSSTYDQHRLEKSECTIHLSQEQSTSLKAMWFVNLNINVKKDIHATIHHLGNRITFKPGDIIGKIRGLEGRTLLSVIYNPHEEESTLQVVVAPLSNSSAEEVKYWTKEDFNNTFGALKWPIGSLVAAASGGASVSAAAAANHIPGDDGEEVFRFSGWDR